MGIEAQARYAAWQTTVNQYQDELVAYYKALGDRDTAINQLRKESPDGVIPPDKVPPEVKQPQRPQILSTNPAQGYVIKLSPGNYDIQMKRADGTIQPDSRKKLVMFDKQREGIAYSVVPSTALEFAGTIGRAGQCHLCAAGDNTLFTGIQVGTI